MRSIIITISIKTAILAGSIGVMVQTLQAIDEKRVTHRAGFREPGLEERIRKKKGKEEKYL